MTTHLHVRSAYTLLSSTLKVKDIIAYTKQNNAKAVALVDKDVMCGAISFYHNCIDNDVKPIFGLEVECIHLENKISFIIYAKDDIGYQSLLKLSSYINTTKELLTLNKLLEFDTHTIITTAGSNDDLQSMLLNDKQDEIAVLIKYCQDNIDDFYVAVAMNDSGLLRIKNEILQQICSSKNIKTFALSRIYYGEEKDEEAFKVLCAINQQKNVDDPTLEYSSKRYFRSADEMENLYTVEQLENADEIANKCNVEMKLKKALLPVFNNKYHVDSETYLRNLCKTGLQKRLNNQISKEYVNRLTYELDVIINMGYADYFIIVYDFIRYAKTKDIYVGPGRGSAAGSLVAYCLGITHVDPIKYHLLFERFLNPERISMPDIDIDFPDNRRDEVIDYVKDLYGDSHVAHIITFGTLAAKQVLRDVGKALNISIREIDMLCKMIPNTPKITLNSVFENSGKFKQTILANKKYIYLFEMGKKLEGLPRHASTHAAGIVLSNCDISDVCPIIQIEENVYSTQFTMDCLEELGLIKIDFLGLRNLTIIDEVCQNINQVMNDKIDIMKIPLDDNNTFKLIQAVDTMGVFQLESEGMKNLIRKMKPKNFEEIAATIALFRPGPMENIPLYLENRSHPETIDYFHPKLESILKNTYGVMIYQEQIMQVVQVMANFSLGKADILRKAISKKKSAELKLLQADFISGAIKNGYGEVLSKHIYELIMKFAGYGFNRSHSIAYGLIAYQLAYLKANHALAFFMSLLNSVIGSEYKTSQYIFEAKKRKICILLPCINASGMKYIIESEALRFPLLNIKSVGLAATKEIIEERNENGYFDDYFDFIARISTRRISRKVIESLIDAGALDCFKIGRISMKMSLDDALRYASLVSVEDEDQVRIDLDLVSKPILFSAKEDSSIISDSEKEVLGFYLSKHPISDVRMQYVNARSVIEVCETKGYVKLVCFIERIKEHRTKNGDLMAFISASDETAKIDIVCMPNIYAKHAQTLTRGMFLYIEGKMDKPHSCLVNHLVEIDSNH